MKEFAMEPTTIDRLTDALQDAADAHHFYEVEIGGPHADWPRWYAEHMTRTLREAGYRLRPDPQ